MNEQLIVILVVAVIALVKWALKNAGEVQGGDADESRNTPEREQRPPPPRSLRPGTESMAREESEEEKMRRFMEALGLPQSSPPPPMRKPTPKPAPAAERPAYNPLPTPKPHPRQLGRPTPPTIFPSPGRRKIAPPLDTGKPLPTLPKTASVSESAPSMEVASIPQMTFAQPEQAVQSAAAEVASATTQPARPATKKQQPSAQAALREQLRDPDSLRKAILLREILGAPKGLQSAQTPSIFSPL